MSKSYVAFYIRFLVFARRKSGLLDWSLIIQLIASLLCFISLKLGQNSQSGRLGDFCLGRWVGWLLVKPSQELCSPFVTPMPNFIRNLTRIGKDSVWGGFCLDGRMGGKTIPITLNSRFQLRSPFLTSFPSFIKIWPKLAKLMCWGGLDSG